MVMHYSALLLEKKRLEVGRGGEVKKEPMLSFLNSVSEPTSRE